MSKMLYQKDYITTNPNKRKSLKRKQNLIQASLKTRKESMVVNTEFSQIEDVPRH